MPVRHPPVLIQMPPGYPFPDPESVNRYQWAARRKARRKQLRTSVILFVLTFISTTLAGSGFGQLLLIPSLFGGEPAVALKLMLQLTLQGFTYSIPLMTILLCHEMGHFLQAVRYRVPASFPYFIPLPIPPLGTMGAVIFQGRGAADRKQMFDIAISGPLAGLIVTLPVLYYGISQSQIVVIPPEAVGMRFGEPLIVVWMIERILGPLPEGGQITHNGFYMAGWVGIFITALNLLPVGQLDGGHILYTLIGRKAHWVAFSVIAFGVGAMVYSNKVSYVLLIVLLLLTGPRHPPTADDTVPLGRTRTILGWLTLAFLIIGFTPQPIIVPEGS
ncbi:MAG: site-2 protease family protein [Planctomycetaceae bacterium]